MDEELIIDELFVRKHQKDILEVILLVMRY